MANMQLSMGLSMVKNNADAEQAIANVLIQNSSPGRGQNVDITL